jgi:hypothetical protein
MQSPCVGGAGNGIVQFGEDQVVFCTGFVGSLYIEDGISDGQLFESCVKGGRNAFKVEMAISAH